MSIILQLKTYATSQESKQSAAIHAGDIAYTLSENRMLYPNLDQSDISFELIIYCVFGYFLLMVLGFHLLLSNNMNLLKSAYENFFEHVEVVFPAVLIGLLFVICEFIATTVYLKDLVAFTTFHMYVWFPSLFLILYIFYKVVRLCCKKDKDKSDYIKCILTVVTGTMLLFLIHIYCYALPTFLLLLVYPTKVIAVVAYLATFIFAASIMFSISLRLIITFVFHFRTIGRCTSIMMIINAIVVFLNPIFMFTIVIHFLYALVLGEASAISAGPYTVLSLIPTAAISAVSWLFKNKVFSSTAEEEDEQPKDDNEDDTGDNENGGTHSEADGEALRLVVNEDTPASRNGREVNSYGATGNN